MKARRSIHETADGVVLVESAPGTEAFVAQSKQTAELDIDDKQWKRLHRSLKTGKLDFVKVKATHGINEVE